MYPMKTNAISSIKILLAALTFMVSCKSETENQTNSQLTNPQIVAIAKKAYEFGYPLVLMEYTKRASTNVAKPNSSGQAPINQIAHLRSFPDHTFTDVVKVNVDTYYSAARLELGLEPMVLKVPKTDRYYLLPMLDAYTNVFASTGTRTTGNDAQTFLITGPFWEGAIPDGMTEIEAPTNMVWMIGRTQVNNPEDGQKIVVPFQDGISLTPLSQINNDYTPTLNEIKEEYRNIIPIKKTRQLPINEFFNLMISLMVENPASKKDSAILNQMAKIGLISGNEFNISSFPPEVIDSLNRIPEQTHTDWIELSEKGNPDLLKNGWLYLADNMGDYGRNYAFRSFIAYFGLGANLPEDAIYPSTYVDSEGMSLDGSNKYVIHITVEDLPPTNAFWSLTAYDQRDFLVENSINKFSVGDRDNLTYNKDGSLDIYIQNSSPGKIKESNWLPTPQEGIMSLTFRLYWPKEKAVNSMWTPPSVAKVK